MLSPNFCLIVSFLCLCLRVLIHSPFLSDISSFLCCVQHYNLSSYLILTLSPRDSCNSFYPFFIFSHYLSPLSSPIMSFPSPYLPLLLFAPTPLCSLVIPSPSFLLLVYLPFLRFSPHVLCIFLYGV